MLMTPGGKSVSLGDHLAYERRAPRGVGGGFEHHGAAGRQCGANLWRS